MAIDRELFGPQGEDENEVFALESLVFSVQVALQRAMNKQGITSKQLAERLGMSPARVSQIFSKGGPNLTLKTIAKVQAALDEDFEFISKSDRRSSGRVGEVKPYVLFAIVDNKSPWQEVKPGNLNRKAELVAA